MFVFRFIRRAIEIFILGVVAYYLVSGVQVVTASRAAGAVGAAPSEPVVLVVASGPTGGSAPLGADFAARLGHAAALRTGGRSGRIVVLAGSQLQASKARQYLVSHGTPATAVSTLFAGEIPGAFHLYAKAHPPSSALLVSDSWQVLWLTHVASANGLKVTASPIDPTDGGVGNEAKTVAVQAAAVAWGRIVGFGQTGFIAG